MTVLKWLVVLASMGYLGGLAVLFLRNGRWSFRYRKPGARPRRLPAFRKLKSTFWQRRMAKRSSFGMFRQDQDTQSSFIVRATAIFSRGLLAAFEI